MANSPQRVMSFVCAAAAATAALAGGCGDGGQLTLELEFPETDELSPLAGDRLGEISLVVSGPEVPRRRETRTVTERGVFLDMGSLPPGSEVTVAVELHSRTQRLIGFARSLGPVTIEADREVVVPLAARRPFAYVPGGGEIDLGGGPRAFAPTLATFDASVDPDGSASRFRGAIDLGFAPAAAAGGPDGRELLIAGDQDGQGRLLVLSTSTHGPAGPAALSIAPGPTDVAVSPDGRRVVVGHGGGDGGVSVVDLAALREGQEPGSAFVALGPVGAVAVTSAPEGAARVFALVDRARAHECQQAPASEVAVLSLDDPSELGLALAYDGPIHDIAAVADGSAVLVADACRGGIFRVPVDGGSAEEVLPLPGASAVAVLDGRVWAAGALAEQPPAAARATLASIELGGGAAVGFDLPESFSVALLSHPEFSHPVQQKLGAHDVLVRELAAAPGGNQVALLVQSEYFAERVILEVLGVPFRFFPPRAIQVHEYLLVDAGSGAIVQRLRTACELRETPDDDLYTGWDCERAADPGLLPRPEEYVPRNLAILYGAR